jgi:signal transduction histidine kinase
VRYGQDAAVAGIATEHGGQVDATNAQGGARFVLTLPLDPATCA